MHIAAAGGGADGQWNNSLSMSMSDEVCKHQSTFGPRDIYQSKFNIYSHEMRFHEVDIEATN